MTSISVISPMLDKVVPCHLLSITRHEQYFCSAQDSLPAMSAMIDTETSVNHLVEHAANRKKLGKVQCGDVVFLVVKIVKSSRTFV